MDVDRDRSKDLSREEIRRAFTRAASRYDEFAVLQREVGERLVSRLDFMQVMPRVVMDLGAGTGYCARLLEKRYQNARVLLVDISPDMLLQARQQARRWFSRAQFISGDACRLPVRNGSVDLVFSNLALQWCEDLRLVFAECRRVLRPGGLVLFSTLGPDTLQELRAAWAAVDDAPHVNVFVDMHDVGDAMVAAGLSSPVLDRDELVLTYPSARALMRDLKGIGAHNSHLQRPRGLHGRTALATVERAYERHRRDGQLPATYEIVYGHGWAPHADTRPQDGSTVATFPLHRLSRRAE